MGGKGKGGCMGPWQLVGLGLGTDDGRWRKGYSFLMSQFRLTNLVLP